MARITVEDCLEKVPNMFQLVLVAAKRARQLANGAHPMVDWENDKPTVVALREIAEGYITEEILTQRDKPVEDILAADLAAVTPMSPDDLLGSRPVSIGDQSIGVFTASRAWAWAIENFSTSRVGIPDPERPNPMRASVKPLSVSQGSSAIMLRFLRRIRAMPWSASRR